MLEGCLVLTHVSRHFGTFCQAPTMGDARCPYLTRIYVLLYSCAVSVSNSHSAKLLARLTYAYVLRPF